MSFPARCWLATISLIVTGCVRTPESYPAPEPHLPFRAHDIGLAEFVSMDDPHVLKYIVKDVNTNEPSAWRWTGGEPELRFTLSSALNRTLLVEFVVHERIFEKTGPMTVTFYVNDRRVGEERYDSKGEKVFEKLIPSEWLAQRPETRVRLQIHNPWVSPEGDTLAILLKRVGFVQ